MHSIGLEAEISSAYLVGEEGGDKRNQREEASMLGGLHAGTGWWRTDCWGSDETLWVKERREDQH